MREFLKSSSKTVIKVFKKLENAKLIKQENQGKGKIYKIFVLDIYSEDEQKKNLHTTRGKNENKVLEFLQPNKIYKNNINKSYSNERDYSKFDWTSLYANKC